MGRKIFTILLFAVMMFVIGVTAASAELVSLPSAEFLSNAFSGFLPIVMSSSAPEAEGPVGALIVFSTAAKTTGDAGGRVGMSEKCAAEDPNAHFCEIGELHSSITTTGVVFNSSNTQASWIDFVGPAIGVDWVSNSCNGFNGEGGEGYTIKPKATDFSFEPCTSDLHVLCCKWVP